MDPVYPDSVTWWHRLPDEGRRAAWERARIPEAHVEDSAGRSRLAPADAGAGASLVLVPARHAGLAQWAPGDRFAIGASESDDPPAEALTATSVERVRMCGALHHLEIAGS